MRRYIDNTIVVSGPKRSGTTLLNRLFDSHPGVVDLVDEAFFWEHVYNHKQQGTESLFVNIFRTYGPGDLAAGMMDRDILPWIDGRYRQPGVPHQQDLDLKFKHDLFLQELGRARECASVQELWDCVVSAYARASAPDYSGCHTAFIKCADYGRSILAAQSTLEKCASVLIIRNPFSAIDSLKKSRELRNAKMLHPFNMAEVIGDYLFLWHKRSSLLAGKAMLVRFEDLVADPEPMMKAMAGHVGVEYTANLLSPTLRGQSWVGLSSFTKTAQIDRSIPHRDIQVLDEEDIDFIGQNLKELLDEYDYKPRRGARAKATLRTARR